MQQQTLQMKSRVAFRPSLVLEIFSTGRKLVKPIVQDLKEARLFLVYDDPEFECSDDTRITPSRKPLFSIAAFTCVVMLKTSRGFLDCSVMCSFSIFMSDRVRNNSSAEIV